MKQLISLPYQPVSEILVRHRAHVGTPEDATAIPRNTAIDPIQYGSGNDAKRLQYQSTTTDPSTDAYYGVDRRVGPTVNQVKPGLG